MKKVRKGVEEEQIRRLIGEACKARRRAYAPYSRFRVGAAVLSKDGRVFVGCNVENASYGLTVCAERVAIGNAITQGAREFVAIAVVYSARREAVPCGACRQVLREFGGEMYVISATTRGKYRVRRLSDLLPGSFGGEELRE
ncbi:MAG: cytidine deaminase [bacterium]|nr:cytidine deaminase [bacterium]